MADTPSQNNQPTIEESARLAAYRTALPDAVDKRPDNVKLQEARENLEMWKKRYQKADQDCDGRISPQEEKWLNEQLKKQVEMVSAPIHQAASQMDGSKGYQNPIDHDGRGRC